MLFKLSFSARDRFHLEESFKRCLVHDTYLIMLFIEKAWLKWLFLRDSEEVGKVSNVILPFLWEIMLEISFLFNAL